MLLNLEKPPEKHQPTDDDPITRMERPREIILKIGQLKRHHEASSSRSNKKKKKKKNREKDKADGRTERGRRTEKGMARHVPLACGPSITACSRRQVDTGVDGEAT